MNFYTLVYDRNPDFCAVYKPCFEMRHRNRSSTGMRVGELHDANATFRMAKEVKGKMVPDFIRQVIGQVIVSPLVADILKDVVNSEVEYLPVSLTDHRNKIAKDNLVLVNVIGYYDCVDRTKTEGHPTGDLAALEKITVQKKDLSIREYENDNFPDYEYVQITRLFLRPERTPTDANLFRLRSYIRALVFREDVVARLTEAKVTGATFVPLGQPVEI